MSAHTEENVNGFGNIGHVIFIGTQKQEHGFHLLNSSPIFTYIWVVLDLVIRLIL